MNTFFHIHYGDDRARYNVVSCQESLHAKQQSYCLTKILVSYLGSEILDSLPGCQLMNLATHYSSLSI